LLRPAITSLKLITIIKNDTFINMNKIAIGIILFFTGVFTAINSPAQKADKKLEMQIQELLKGFHGNAGVYVHDLKKNRIAAIHSDSVFPTASMIKIPIVIGVMDKIEKGRITISPGINL